VIGQSVMSEDRRIEVGGDDYGRWLAEVVDALGLDRFDLVGASWGGFVATRGASVLGDRVRRLVLIVPAGFVAGSAWAGFTKMGWPIMMYRAFPSQARLEKLVRELFSEADPMWARYFGDAMRAYKLDMRIPPLLRPEQAAKLAGPVLVVAAEHDLSFPGRSLLERAKAALLETWRSS
jgi:2-hydroxy-6-oxonona-2,4-dienedioate hydrolase